MNIVLTGANGFLGWHFRSRAHALGEHVVVPVGRVRWSELRGLVASADAVVHVAGMNRGTAVDIEHTNIALARAVADAVSRGKGRPRVVFANSIQAGNGTPYGIGKAAASDILASAAREAGSDYVDVRLPNLFGEHGRPDYNSFVATFIATLLADRTPDIEDRPIRLLHVQEAAAALLDAARAEESQVVWPAGHQTTVGAVLGQLKSFRDLYRIGEIPPLQSDFDVALFNTWRAACFPDHYPIPLVRRADHRGELTEVVRSGGGAGHFFVSTTVPGATRGNHFHLTKIERFVVIRGHARISLRRLFTNDVLAFDVSGEEPSIVDMPTMWAHSLTNIANTELTTLFWSNQLFDSQRPDTYPELVHPVHHEGPTTQV